MLYIPILKDRPAELKALTLLHHPRSIVLSGLWPLIEVRSPDDESGVLSSLDKIIRDITASPCKQFLIDLNGLDVNLPTATVSVAPSTYHPLEYLSVLTAGKCRITPVANITSSSTLIAEIVKTIAIHQAGVAIRLTFDDLNDPALTANLAALVGYLSQPESNIHIIIDAAAITENNMSAILMAINGSIASLPHATAWASITVAASAYPASSPQTTGGPSSIVRIPRSEWELFKRLHARFTHLGLNFGDYGIDNPDFAPNPNARAVSNLKYTTDTEWLFVKGKLVSQGGAQYFRDVCRVMAAQSEYMLPHYSWGDEFIDVCGSGGGGTGNATSWRQIAVTHHITFVLDQLNHFATGGSATPPVTSPSL